MNPQILSAIRLGLTMQIGANDIAKAKVTPVGGGCIHRAFKIEAEPPFFVKVNGASCEAMFDAEHDALDAMASTCAIRVPCPLLRGRIGDESFLVLEFLSLRGGTDESWRQMGEQLAALHQNTSRDSRFGWHRDNYIGATPQRNTWHSRWPDFWREERLGFQIEIAARKGMRFDGSDRLLHRIDSYFTDYLPEPSLLHGDLWSGNAAFTDDGKPVIFDPACYFGDRECDLAFTEMFGGFPKTFYDAYDAAWPRDPGWRTRRDVYNLYHVLNHANLFGGYYEGQAREMIGALLRKR